MLRVLPLFVATVLLAAAACGGSSQPEAIREGRTIYGNVCSACHGNAGGGGIGPGLATVTETWPDCSDHVEWVGLGSDGWKAEHGDTYGATNKPVNGGMPAHADSLTLDQRRAVAAWERSQYGDVSVEVALQDCGLPAAVP